MQQKIEHMFNSYGEALKWYLKKKGIKQSYIVEKTGKGKGEISNYVNSKVMPGEESQQKIEELLGISIDQATPKDWIIRSKLMDSAQNGAAEVERQVNDYIERGLRSVDPQLLLELAEVLIRTAKEAMKKNKQSNTQE